MESLVLSLRTAMRFMRSSRREGIISFISVISVMGITLGVAVLVVGLSVLNGFERELKNRILAVVPHGEIEAVSQPLKGWASMLPLIQGIPGILAAEPYVNFIALMENDLHLHAVQVRGVSLTQEDQLSPWSHFVQNRSAWMNFKAGEHQLILGKGAADSLGVKVGSYLTAMIPNKDPGLKLIQPKYLRLHVTGILQLSGQLDHSLALLPLRDAQQYLDIGDSITGIAIKVDEIFDANKLVRDAGEATNTYVYTRSWIETYGYMYRDIQMIRAIMYLAMFLVIAVACFNIISTLIIVVEDKSTDIAVLRTLGAKDSFISAIFIWYGILSGLIGGLIGIAIGATLSLKLTTIIKGVEKLLGRPFLSGDIYFIDFLPSELLFLDMMMVLSVVMILTFIVTWYPANRACQIDPAQLLGQK